MHLKIFFIIVLWKTFHEGESVYFAQNNLTLEISSWELSDNSTHIHALTAVLDPDESGEISYSITPIHTSSKKNGVAFCPILNISPKGHILFESYPTVSNPTATLKGNGTEGGKRRRSLAPCSYLAKADLQDGTPGMRNETKANTIVVLSITKEKEGEKTGVEYMMPNTTTNTAETQCNNFVTYDELCFDGKTSLHIQVMENSQRIRVGSFGYRKKAFQEICSAPVATLPQLKYSVLMSSKRTSEGVLTVHENDEDPSLVDLWVRANLDRESIPFYNLTVFCSVRLPNESSTDDRKMMKLAGEITVLDQDDNAPCRTGVDPNSTVNISLHADNMKNTKHNKLEPNARLEPDGGHLELTISDKDSVNINNKFSVEVQNDTKRLLKITSNPLPFNQPNASSVSSLVIIRVALADRVVSWEGYYCVSIIYTDTTLVIGHENSTIRFNVCLHGGIEPFHGPRVTEKEDAPLCGSGCIVSSTIGAFLVVFVILPIICLNRYRNSTKGRKIPVPSHSSGLLPPSELDYFVPSGNALVHFVDYLPPDPKWEIPRSAVILQEIIGEGEFGEVVRGKYRNPGDSQGRAMDVAVKTLKDNQASGKSSRDEFMAEFSLLKQVDHINVIKLIGVCTSAGGPPMLVMEYAELKSLRSYLRRVRRIETTHCPTISFITELSSVHVSRLSAQDRDWEMELYQTNPKEILGFCWQIAKGMAYLTEMKMVHRDLAARNILLTRSKVCKISDFGLTRDVYTDDAYKKKSKDRVPVKWLAPECLSDELYTAKSDVWSFGVVCWELVMMGQNPYPGIPTEQLFPLLKSGYRMPKPQHCSSELYDVMLQCWEYNPSDRPRFRELVESLGKLLEDGIDYLQLNIPSISNPGYGFNIPTSDNNENSSCSFFDVPNNMKREQQSMSNISENSMENLRLIDHCDDSLCHVAYTNGFAHTYINSRGDKHVNFPQVDHFGHSAPSPSSSSTPAETAVTAGAVETKNHQRSNGVPVVVVPSIINSAYESPIKMKKSESISND